MIKTWQQDLEPDEQVAAFDLKVPAGEKWHLKVLNVGHEGEGAAHVEMYLTPNNGGKRQRVSVVSGTEPTMRRQLFATLDSGERIEVLAESRFHDHPCEVAVGLSYDREVVLTTDRPDRELGVVTVKEIHGMPPVKLDPEGVVAVEGPPGPPGPPGPSAFNLDLISTQRSSEKDTAVVEVPGQVSRVVADLRNATKAVLQVLLSTVSGTPVVRVEYSADGGTWATLAEVTDLAANILKVGAPVSVPAGAKTPATHLRALVSAGPQGVLIQRVTLAFTA